VHLLVRLVDDLLDLARIRSGKVELRSAPIQLSEVVAHAVETAGPVLAAKGHALTIEVPTGLTIQGDLLRLTQAVANLLTNAAKYTPAGGAIHVSGDRRGPNVRVRVADNGIGISAKMLPLVFDRFAQEAQSADNPPGGLGLGLSIVRSLVVMHGGTVSAHSAGIGRGSQFVIELPALTGQVAAAPVPSVVALVPVASVAEQRVLVIDDNPLVADLVALALGRLGHEVRIALDPAAAISIARDFLPNIVLVDVGLPGLAGYEVAPLVREAVLPHDVHFIAISGRGGATERQRSVDAGFDDHLVKPVDVAMIERSIEQSIRR
jgi:CheY-like chemotaxis protein